MKLCTFEVRTHLGRHQRLGAVTDAGIVDLNFACAALLGGNYHLADAVVPSAMLAFLEAGALAMDKARKVVTCQVWREVYAVYLLILSEKSTRGMQDFIKLTD